MGWWMGDSVIEDDEKIGADEAKRVIRRAFSMLGPYRAQVVLGMLIMVLSTMAILAGPALVRYGIDQGLKAGNSGALDRAALAYLAVAISVAVLTRLQIMMLARVGEGFLRDLRLRVFDHIQKMSMGFFDKEQTGKLVARMTSDIDSLQELVQQG